MFLSLYNSYLILSFFHILLVTTKYYHSFYSIPGIELGFIKYVIKYVGVFEGTVTRVVSSKFDSLVHSTLEL